MKKSILIVVVSLLITKVVYSQSSQLPILHINLSNIPSQHTFESRTDPLNNHTFVFESGADTSRIDFQRVDTFDRRSQSGDTMEWTWSDQHGYPYSYASIDLVFSADKHSITSLRYWTSAGAVPRYCEIRLQHVEVTESDSFYRFSLSGQSILNHGFYIYQFDRETWDDDAQYRQTIDSSDDQVISTRGGAPDTISFSISKAAVAASVSTELGSTTQSNSPNEIVNQSIYVSGPYSTPILVLDLLGREVLRTSASGASVQRIDVSQLPPGVYYLAKARNIRKFLVQH